MRDKLERELAAVRTKLAKTSQAWKPNTHLELREKEMYLLEQIGKEMDSKPP